MGAGAANISHRARVPAKTMIAMKVELGQWQVHPWMLGLALPEN